MHTNKVIRLNTSNGEEVLVNFRHVTHCIQTNNNHSSLRFSVALGKDYLGVYLNVIEEFDKIQELLENNENVTNTK